MNAKSISAKAKGMSAKRTTRLITLITLNCGDDVPTRFESVTRELPKSVPNGFDVTVIRVEDLHEVILDGLTARVSPCGANRPPVKRGRVPSR